MGNTFGGRIEEGSTGTLTQVWSHPRGQRPKTGGVTFDWSTVVAPVADVTLPDGSVIKAGVKYVRYGMFIARITATGKYGIYDNETPAADGRQLRVRGECFFLDKTVLETDDMSNHPPAYEGGTVYLARMALDVAEIGYMTRAQAEELFPDLKFVSTAR